ncbi:DUF1707 SHOCT-like domain-containing protein [Nocardia huaxiensis]|uniref:DUF1707 domain-containing protein n=1 Tax=Nocardia huaxiensis TaxID=2755382 RepID=A0A7D6ZHZ8_9NOCA|nr:DUF1707 domain-containing protein [Nocardia huaxiensis]QLY31007.1 DUF1707 domain-containing protein [Nocardia huaxiensis]UFS94528.1 DUF1707 domain-containing protein [Nocardia huaxiensis]
MSQSNEKRSTAAVRIDDLERTLTARRLQHAVGEGRLDLMELDRRLGAVYAARTNAELSAVTADLPDHNAETLDLRVGSGTKRVDGQWEVPDRLTAECGSGTIHIDFNNAYCARRQITVKVEIGSGAVVLIVPRGWRVDLDRVQCGSGSVVNRVKLPHFPGAPILRVEGKVNSGAVKARYRYRSPWAWLKRSHTR